MLISTKNIIRFLKRFYNVCDSYKWNMLKIISNKFGVIENFNSLHAC
jgi:hypothetical protein